jgi:hypothetical protein
MEAGAVTELIILALFLLWSCIAYWIGYRACMREWNAHDPWTVYWRRESEVKRLVDEGWTKSTALGHPVLFPPAPPCPARPARPTDSAAE